MKTFHIGQRVTHYGHPCTVCSALIQVTPPVGKAYFVYLVLFDKFSNGETPDFRNEELGYITIGAMPVNEKFLEEII